MPNGTNYREGIGNQVWGTEVRIALATLFVAAMGFAMRLYVVQEILIVLILLAASTVTILGLAIAFILCHEGIRWAVFWVKTGAEHLADISLKAIGSDEHIVSSTWRTRLGAALLVRLPKSVNLHELRKRAGLWPS